MKKIGNGLLLLFIALSIGSCNKEPLGPGDPGEVLFKFEGTIDSNVLFEAGENNYVMYTDYLDNGSSDVLIMKGEFRDKTNMNDNYLRFEFFGYDSVNNTGIQQNVFNQTDYYSYSLDSLSQTTGSTILKFYTLYGAGATIAWDFGDGTTGSGDTVIHTYPVTLNDANVKMSSYQALSNCTDSVDNLVNLTDPADGQVQFGFTAATTLLDSFLFTASPNFTSYTWDFDNQITQLPGTVPNSGVRYTDSLRKTIELTATKGAITSQWRAVLNPNNFSPCYAAFMYDVLSTPVTSFSQRAPFKSCIITYKKNGVVYQSYKNDSRNQSNNIVFNLSSANPYIQNADGQSTIQLRGSLNTFLYNVTNQNDSIPISSSNVSIAVAHP